MSDRHQPGSCCPVVSARRSPKARSLSRNLLVSSGGAVAVVPDGISCFLAFAGTLSPGLWEEEAVIPFLPFYHKPVTMRIMPAYKKLRRIYTTKDNREVEVRSGEATGEVSIDRGRICSTSLRSSVPAAASRSLVLRICGLALAVQCSTRRGDFFRG